MDWIESIKKVIVYMEKHLLDDINADEVAGQVFISSYYLQKGFKIMTGYSMSEYIRYRRLYMAALDVIKDKERVIDLAYKYKYETPESFTRAFTRFHGSTPMQMRKNASHIQTFLPLKISISIQGGNDMDYVVEKMRGFQVIGFQFECCMDSSYEEIPKLWNKFCQDYCSSMYGREKPANETQQAVCDCNVGEFGICIEDMDKNGRFHYLIAGTYNGGSVPDGMTVYEFPDMEWAKFNCTGPMPGALQSVNTRIFKEWFPNNLEYELAMAANIEWYLKGDTTAEDYESAIWVPVKKK